MDSGEVELPVLTIEETGAILEVSPARVGPYVLGECIGRGGMALVYKSKVIGPHGFQKQVVLKQLLPTLTTNAEFVELFTSEAKITAQLGHPGIVQVLDFGVASGTPYLVLEYLDGVNLSQLLNQVTTHGQLVPVDVAVVILTQVCHALGYAHGYRDSDGVRRQVVHGDVSPSNIMVCKDALSELQRIDDAMTALAVIVLADAEPLHHLGVPKPRIAPQLIARALERGQAAGHPRRRRRDTHRHVGPRSARENHDEERAAHGALMESEMA